MPYRAGSTPISAEGTNLPMIRSVSDQRWEKIAALFDAALDHPPENRSA